MSLSRSPDARARRAWLAVAACATLILLFSGDEFSAGATSRVFGPLLRWLFPDLDAASFHVLHLWVRKLAHLTEYALLGLLAFRALRLSLAISLPRTALLDTDGQPKVFVVTDGKAAERAVTLGLSNGAWIEVTEGLKDGEQVVVVGQGAVKPGTAVRVVNSTARPAAARLAPVTAG